MYHPNQRYGNPAALRAYTSGMSIRSIARQLHRHPRTVNDWLTGKRPLPWWVPELLQLRHEVALHDLRRMGIKPAPMRTPTTNPVPSRQQRREAHLHLIKP